MFLIDLRTRKKNLAKHIHHAKAMGMSIEQYDREAEKLSNVKSSTGSIDAYVSNEDGNNHAHDWSKNWHVVYSGNVVITFFWRGKNEETAYQAKYRIK